MAGAGLFFDLAPHQLIYDVFFAKTVETQLAANRQVYARTL